MYWEAYTYAESHDGGRDRDSRGSLDLSVRNLRDGSRRLAAGAGSSHKNCEDDSWSELHFECWWISSGRKLVRLNVREYAMSDKDFVVKKGEKGKKNFQRKREFNTLALHYITSHYETI
jgi:hypothetical protein